MDVKISNSSDIPIYQQIFNQISSQIIRGELIGGYILPPIRTAAKELRVSIITVKKAWEELERQGFINTMVGRGCFVAESSNTQLMKKRDDLIRIRMSKDMEYYKDLGLTLSEIIEFLKQEY